MNIKILVITHKPYPMPENKELYLPIQSGAAIWPKLGIQPDDTGDNISSKNLAYNELCPMYWAWKNMDAEYIGVCHYRRLFSNTKKGGHGKRHTILSYETAVSLCSQHNVILPAKRRYIFSIKNHYILANVGMHDIGRKDIEILRMSVIEEAPEYLAAFDKVMNGHFAHMLHLCLMRRDYYNDYCDFVFKISFRVEQLSTGRSNRYIGALSELLMDVWLQKNNIEYYELGVIELEHKSILRKLQYYSKKTIERLRGSKCT